MKRAIDIIFSALCLLISLPAFAFIAALIKISSPGPVFARQKKIGMGLKPFIMLGFRTSRHPYKPGGSSTFIGRLLEKTGFACLPSLLNVLAGEMSLIGPGPQTRKYINLYRKDFEEVFKVRPGLKDVWRMEMTNPSAQERMKKDAEYFTHLILPEKIRAYKDYSNRASFLQDLSLTAVSVFEFLYPIKAIRGAIELISPYRKPIIIGGQILIFAAANYLAFYVRFDGWIPSPQMALFFKYLPLIITIRIMFLYAFSLEKGLWRYVSVRELLNIVTSVTTGSLFFFLILNFFDKASYPKSIYVLDWSANIFLLGGVRLFKRIHESATWNRVSRKRVIVIGAGDAAEMLLRNIERSPLYSYDVVGLIDENKNKTGLKIRNVPIIGTIKELDEIIEENRPDELFIACPSAQALKLQEIVKDIRRFGLPIKTVPSLLDILTGRDISNMINVLEPEDVLFRAPVSSEDKSLKEFFAGKSVMVTGAGGSIGSELSKQVAYFCPQTLILYERHEENLYKIDMHFKNLGDANKCQVASIIGDIMDEKRLVEVMEKYHPNIIFHAAAYKHVPLMEENPLEAFKTNVIGTKTVAEVSRDFGVERFVQISTDKAVDPVNVMGLTKKIAENIINRLSEACKVLANYQTQDSDFPVTKYMIVRFGNVLGSSGSVVPLFKEQISRGGPVTVTHPEMTRYFMTISEAVSLVLQVSAMGNGGEVFVLDMGKSIRILDLAKRMISLYGYKPGVDMDIAFTGLRPGEKLYEDLFNSNEVIEKTRHPKINMAVSASKSNVIEITELFNSLKNHRISRYNSEIKEIISKVVA
ncbi:MAG: polysaccharide biosynthesis protein [Deltaproteobacteria bacterium]|nr:polysaccharide biosynthesis protein [Deltaproteobacteria bacterium]